MRLSDYILLALLLFLIGLILYEFICVLRNMPKIKQCENKVRVKEKSVLYIAWIVLSVFNGWFNFLQYFDNQKDKPLHLICGAVWTIFAIHYIFSFLFARDVYITSEGVLYKCRSKMKVSCDEYKYCINGDILELYDKNAIRSAKFKITENKDELIKLLEENYTPYRD